MIQILLTTDLQFSFSVIEGIAFKSNLTLCQGKGKLFPFTTFLISSSEFFFLVTLYSQPLSGKNSLH